MENSNIISYLIVHFICGGVNILCIYLADVVYLRPDCKKEFKWLSIRTIFTILAGPILTGAIWMVPLLAKDQLEMYNRN